MNLNRIFGVFFGIIFGLITSKAALAWGPEGHQTTGFIAQSLLTPEAQVRLKEFLPDNNLSLTATWLDDNRLELNITRPGSSQWHFYNLPVCDNKPRKELCLKGNCAIYRINEYIQVLKDPNSSKEDKIFAVRVLVHVVGDIHQPLHAGDNNDRGGNQVKVGNHTNLHSEWDHAFVRKLAKGRKPEKLAEDLKVKYSPDFQVWQMGDPLQWANESNDAARRVAYGKLPGFTCEGSYLFVDNLPNSYVAESLGVIEKRIAMAGARIAFVLNNALAKPQ